jgi:hypothetical protein
MPSALVYMICEGSLEKWRIESLIMNYAKLHPVFLGSLNHTVAIAPLSAIGFSNSAGVKAVLKSLTAFSILRTFLAGCTTGTIVLGFFSEEARASSAWKSATIVDLLEA